MLLKLHQNQQLTGTAIFCFCKYKYVLEINPILYNKIRLINGKEVTNKDGVQIEKDVNSNKYSLTIPKANPAVHSGTISVKASNAIGTAQHDITLSILGIYSFLPFQIIVLIDLTISLY